MTTSLSYFWPPQHLLTKTLLMRSVGNVKKYHCSLKLAPLSQTDHPCLGAGRPQPCTIPSHFVMPSTAHTAAEMQGIGL